MTAINRSCPRSGHPVAEDSLTTYRGKVVGFCNPGCRDDFAANVEDRPKDRAYFDALIAEDAAAAPASCCATSPAATGETQPADAQVRPPLPPFDLDGALRKVRAAEDAWNSRDPERVALAYSEDSRWRNRSEFIAGRAQIEAFLRRKWAREHEYRLVKEYWAHADNRIAVRFAYGWHDDDGQWFRSYGNENWEFDSRGLMRVRHASINDVAIEEVERVMRWPAGPRPQDHPGLSELGL